MDLFREADALEDIGRLDVAWKRPETFAFLPNTSGVGEAWVEGALSELPEALRTDHFALLTSGSTGTPKLVVGERSRAEALARLLHEVQRSGDVEATLLALPLSYCYAFVNQWLWARVMGRGLVLTPGLSDPQRLHEELVSVTNHMLCLVGSQVPLLERYFPGRCFPGVKRLHFAGGRFPQEHMDTIRAMFPQSLVFNNYGCAEAMPRITLRPASGSNDPRQVGEPLPGVELRTDANGELVFRSRYGAVAYVDDNGFHAIDPSEWVATGDLGRACETGGWLVLGRANEVFKRHGEKISLPQLLTSLTADWKEQAAFYRELDPGGEEGCVLVLAPAPDEDELRGILRALRSDHPRAHWPLRVESMAALPLLPNEKPDVAALASSTGKTVHWYQRI